MNNILSHLKRINEPWVSIGIGEVNGSPVSARVMDNVEANFHTHDNADEFFFVLSGRVFIDTEEGSIELNEGQYHTVKSGTKHRARSDGRAELIVVGGQDA